MMMPRSSRSLLSKAQSFHSPLFQPDEEATSSTSTSLNSDIPLPNGQPPAQSRSKSKKKRSKKAEGVVAQNHHLYAAQTWPSNDGSIHPSLPYGGVHPQQQQQQQQYEAYMMQFQQYQQWLAIQQQNWAMHMGIPPGSIQATLPHPMFPFSYPMSQPFPYPPALSHPAAASSSTSSLKESSLPPSALHRQQVSQLGHPGPPPPPPPPQAPSQNGVGAMHPPAFPPGSASGSHQEKVSMNGNIQKGQLASDGFIAAPAAPRHVSGGNTGFCISSPPPPPPPPLPPPSPLPCAQQQEQDPSVIVRATSGRKSPLGRMSLPTAVAASLPHQSHLPTAVPVPLSESSGEGATDPVTDVLLSGDPDVAHVGSLGSHVSAQCNGPHGKEEVRESCASVRSSSDVDTVLHSPAMMGASESPQALDRPTSDPPAGSGDNLMSSASPDHPPPACDSGPKSWASAAKATTGKLQPPPRSLPSKTQAQPMLNGGFDRGATRAAAAKSPLKTAGTVLTAAASSATLTTEGDSSWPLAHVKDRTCSCSSSMLFPALPQVPQQLLQPVTPGLISPADDPTTALAAMGAAASASDAAAAETPTMPEAEAAVAAAAPPPQGVSEGSPAAASSSRPNDCDDGFQMVQKKHRNPHHNHKLSPPVTAGLK